MNEEIYRIIHYISLVILTSCIGASTFLTKPKRWIKILGMSASFFLLFGGMGLLAKLYEGPWPLWIKLKLIIWSLVSIGGPLAMKNVHIKKHPVKIYTVLIGLIIMAILIVIKRFDL